jgi:hypothetical protein
MIDARETFRPSANRGAISASLAVRGSGEDGEIGRREIGRRAARPLARLRTGEAPCAGAENAS